MWDAARMAHHTAGPDSGETVAIVAAVEVVVAVVVDIVFETGNRMGRFGNATVVEHLERHAVVYLEEHSGRSVRHAARLLGGEGI